MTTVDQRVSTPTTSVTSPTKVRDTADRRSIRHSRPHLVGCANGSQLLIRVVSAVARKRRRPRRVGFWLCSLLLFCSVPAYGIDRGRKLGELQHTGWTYTEGAPGEVHALAQTTDGYLWLGTATGLFRFDGIRFQPYSPQSGRPFPQRNVMSLLAVPSGGLWGGYW